MTHLTLVGHSTSLTTQTTILAHTSAIDSSYLVSVVQNTCPEIFERKALLLSYYFTFFHRIFYFPKVLLHLFYQQLIRSVSVKNHVFINGGA